MREPPVPLPSTSAHATGYLTTGSTYSAITRMWVRQGESGVPRTDVQGQRRTQLGRADHNVDSHHCATASVTLTGVFGVATSRRLWLEGMEIFISIASSTKERRAV